MPGQIRQSRLSGLFDDKIRHAEFEEVRTEREEACTAVRGALAGGSAFLALRVAKGMQKPQGGHPGRRGQVPGGVRL